jgi:hypothetical protein
LETFEEISVEIDWSLVERAKAEALREDKLKLEKSGVY